MPSTIYARITPEDIVNSRREAYEAKVKNYSPQSRQKLENLSQKISVLNKIKTDELNAITKRQGEILDEYEKRLDFPENHSGIKNARYWLTFSHEAIDYQAAKIYIYNLSSEANIKNDALNLISQLQSELNYAKSTAEKSQGIIENLVADSN